MCRNEAKISILIAEDDALLQHFLSARLSDQEDLTIAGIVGNGREALEAVATLKPQILLLDLSLPELSGMQVLERLALEEDAPAVLVLSGNSSEEAQLEAARLGAKGFVCKAQAGACLAEAVQTVADGELWLSEKIMAQMLHDYPALLRRVRELDKPINHLTDREREVLVRLARGLTNQQIAKELYMSVSTVKAHLRSVFRRFNLPSRTEAAVFAVREGLLDPSAGPVPSP